LSVRRVSYLNAELSAAHDPMTSFVFDYSALYTRICDTVQQEAPMLLLYILLHSNAAFRNFVLSRIDLERLVGRQSAT